MPLQRRMPKSGFSSRVSRVHDEIRLHELNGFADQVVSLESLHKANLIGVNIKTVKVFLSGELNAKVTVAKEIKVTKGAKAAIEKAGGSVEE